MNKYYHINCLFIKSYYGNWRLQNATVFIGWKHYYKQLTVIYLFRFPMLLTFFQANSYSRDSIGILWAIHCQYETFMILVLDKEYISLFGTQVEYNDNSEPRELWRHNWSNQSFEGDFDLNLLPICIGLIISAYLCKSRYR